MTGVVILLASWGTPLLRADEIDLSKPVAASIKPDGIYWSFDGGIIGQSSPEIVKDHSGNGYDGRLSPGARHPLPSYIEGVFGTALHVNGKMNFVEGEKHEKSVKFFKPSVRWRLRDTPGAWDNTKLDMDGKSFTGGIWIKFDEDFIEPWQTVVLFHRGVSQSQWSFRLIKRQGGTWRLAVLGGVSTEATTVFSDHAWHHVAFSCEVQQGVSTVEFWLDGVELGEPVVLDDGRVIPPSEDKDRGFKLGEQYVGSFSTGLIGAFDDAFVTGGIHTFKANKP